MAQIVSSVFYGYPAELIAEWCCVSVGTAVRWKCGEATPSAMALKLFALYRERRVLGNEWQGWGVQKDRLFDPDGNETTQGQLRAYYLVYQLCHELKRGNAEAEAMFAHIMRAAG